MADQYFGNDIKFSHADTGKVMLASLLEGIYNSEPLYHNGRQVRHTFRAYAKLNPILQREWDDVFGSSNRGDMEPPPKEEATCEVGSKKPRDFFAAALDRNMFQS